VFGLFFVGPGPDQVARTFAGRLGTAARIAQIKHELHLDQPLYLQYSHWAWNLLHGNFGYDYYKGQSVSSVIAAAAPATISLVIGAAIHLDRLRRVHRGHLGGAVPVPDGPELSPRRRCSSSPCRRSSSACR
jgi:hypothetical protein